MQKWKTGQKFFPEARKRRGIPRLWFGSSRTIGGKSGRLPGKQEQTVGEAKRLIEIMRRKQHERAVVTCCPCYETHESGC